MKGSCGLCQETQQAKGNTDRITNVLLLKQNREAEQSTCQTGFKGVEAGHTPEAQTADRDNFLSVYACVCCALSAAHLPRL